MFEKLIKSAARRIQKKYWHIDNHPVIKVDGELIRKEIQSIEKIITDEFNMLLERERKLATATPQHCPRCGASLITLWSGIKCSVCKWWDCM